MSSNSARCPVCSTHMHNLNGGRVYCSNACKQKAYRQRKKADDALYAMSHTIRKHVNTLLEYGDGSDDAKRLRAQLADIQREIETQIDILDRQALAGDLVWSQRQGRYLTQYRFD